MDENGELKAEGRLVAIFFSGMIEFVFDKNFNLKHVDFSDWYLFTENRIKIV